MERRNVLIDQTMLCICRKTQKDKNRFLNKLGEQKCKYDIKQPMTILFYVSEQSEGMKF